MRAQEEGTLIDELLNEQRLLTAVTRFAQRHEDHELPRQARYYRDLIPLSLPKQGQQYAFEVDLDQCSGCKACVTACHNLNGLDQNETWRSVGFIHGGTCEQPVQRFVTTACHHCVDPACLNGCPVNAYEKDRITGIVRHLDDQCIGCQYCVLKCPYDVPKYHPHKGIVRKCDMCSSRLAAAEAPACVQACPNEAIRITIVDQCLVAAEIQAQTQSTNCFLPAAPEPGYTLPTTKYKTRGPLPANMRPGDFDDIQSEPAHPPLIFMLVLTQLSVGVFCLNFVLELLLPEDLAAPLRLMPTAAVAFGLFGLGASIFHLGRPLLAWKAFLGLKTSWLSREIVVFGIFTLLAGAHAGLFGLPGSQNSPVTQNTLGLPVVLSGLLGVFCSHMIYHDTGRVFWRGIRTAGRFFGTTLLLGVATILCAITTGTRLNNFATLSALQPFIVALCAVLVTASLVKLAWELSFFAHLHWEDLSPMKRSALLMSGELRHATIARFLCGILGGILFPIFLLCSGPTSLISPASVVLVAGGSFLLCLLGELLERYLFFAAVVAPKMPGSVVT